MKSMTITILSAVTDVSNLTITKIIVKHPLPHVPYAALLTKLPNVMKRTRKILYPHVSTVKNQVAQMDILIKPHHESVTPTLLLKIC